ncbi:MAG: DNA polymerase III subunit delta [Pyrinomonadaceae bacterium]
MAALSRNDLRERLVRRELSPVYTLFGQETYLRDLAAKTIADFSFTSSDIREFNETEFSLNTNENLRSALAAAEQLPMMSARRVVRITDVRVSATGAKDTIKDDAEHALMAYLSRPAETGIVIFIADELDKRRKISKLLLENSTAVDFAPLSDNDLLEWARRQMRDAEVETDERTLRHVVELVGNNVRRLTNEISKLITAALPRNRIDFELTEALVPYSRDTSNFELTDHLIAGRKALAVRTLEKILDDGAEPLMILGLISYNFRRLLVAKDMMDRGEPRNGVAKSVKLRYSDQEPFLAAARRTDRANLINALRRLALVDLAIKTSVGGGGPKGARMQIEMLVCELALSTK